MKKITLFILLIIYTTTSQSQTPQLITDFNSGEEDGFNKFNFKAINFENQLIFPVVSAEFGEELGILNDGELSILKDINEGIESSSPKQFVQFKDKVYFSAYDSVNGGCLWSTDGKEGNTQILFSFDASSNARPNGLIVSESGWLYYTYDEVLYRTDGIINENLFTGVEFLEAFQQRSNPYAKYKDEIAFLLEDNDFINLYTIIDGSVVLLATTDETSGFVDLFGLSEVAEGLIFGIDDSFDDNATGTYSYNELNNSLTKISIDNGSAARLHSFTEEASLAWVPSQGIYTTNGIAGQEELLVNATSISLFQGKGITNGVYEDNIIFHVYEGFFGDDSVYYSDGTSSGTSQLFEADAFLSNILVYNNIAFLASGISNGFDPKLYSIDMSNGSFNNFYNFNQSSIQIESVLLLGVQNDKLYFLSNLDDSIGRELYAIDIEVDMDTNTENIEQNKVSVFTTETDYKIISDDTEKLEVKIFTVDGRLLSSESIMSNMTYELPSYNGMCFLSFIYDNNKIVHKFVKVN